MSSCDISGGPNASKSLADLQLVQPEMNSDDDESDWYAFMHHILNRNIKNVSSAHNVPTQIKS